MLSRFFNALGQALVVTVGAGYGIAASLARPVRSGVPGAAEPLEVPARSQHSQALRSLDLRLAAIEARVADLEAGRSGVSMSDLERSTEKLARSLRTEIDGRFAAQDASVQALRVLVGHTAELVEKAVEKLDRV